MIAVSQSNFGDSFKMLQVFGREVMMEQMSKAGTAVRKSIRSQMKSKKAHTTTRVGADGTPYLIHTPLKQFGLRESITIDNQTANPASMASFETSVLMEKSETLVVSGMHPTVRPILRKEGKIVGVGRKVSAIGARTAAILHRMDTGDTSGDYDKRTQLHKGDIARPYRAKGISDAMPKVKFYLEDEYTNVITKAVNNHDFKTVEVSHV